MTNILRIYLPYFIYKGDGGDRTYSYTLGSFILLMGILDGKKIHPKCYLRHGADKKTSVRHKAYEGLFRIRVSRYTRYYQ